MLTIGFMRYILLISSFSCLLYFISCKEVVGPVPEFQFEFSNFDDIALTEVDTAELTSLVDITVLNITVNAGTVTNEAYDALTSEDPATLTALSSSFDNSLSADQITFLQSLNQGSVLNLVDTEDTDFINELDGLRTAFESDASLSNYLPNEVMPSRGRISNGRYRASQTIQTSIPQSKNSTADQIDDCRQAAQDAFDALILELEAARTTELDKINAWYLEKVDVATSSAQSEREASLTRHNDRLESFLTTYNSIVDYVEGLVTSSQLSAAEGANILLFTLNIYAFNIYASLSIYQAEQVLIDELEEEALASLATIRDNTISSVENDYNQQVATAQSALASSQNGCHNQGSGTGS